MQGLKFRFTPIAGVAGAVVIHGHDINGWHMRAHRVPVGLVDVVPQMQEQVDIVALGQTRVGIPEATRIVTAGRHAQAHALGRTSRQGLATANR